MRIVGGKYKGRKLPVSAKLDLRPTTDFARESLFNLLSTRIDLTGINFLDLFAGTGAISFELLSRGAQTGTAVDIAAATLAYRKQIVTTLEAEGLSNFKADVFKFLRSPRQTYDFIFADPPYNLDRLSELPDLVLNGGFLAPGGLFVLEHPEEHTFGQHPLFQEHKRYGRVNFTFFRSSEL